MGDILQRFKQPEEPEEIVLVKQFIQENFKMPATVAIRNDALIITVSSAALANTLRMRVTQLKAFSKTTKRLVFMIRQF